MDVMQERRCALEQSFLDAVLRFFPKLLRYRDEEPIAAQFEELLEVRGYAATTGQDVDEPADRAEKGAGMSAGDSSGDKDSRPSTPTNDQRGAACPTDLSIHCPTCGTGMQPEHAHYRCLKCGYRDSCCM